MRFRFGVTTNQPPCLFVSTPLSARLTLTQPFSSLPARHILLRAARPTEFRMNETSKPSSAKPAAFSRRQFARRAALASAVAADPPSTPISPPPPHLTLHP